MSGLVGLEQSEKKTGQATFGRLYLSHNAAPPSVWNFEKHPDGLAATLTLAGSTFNIILAPPGSSFDGARFWGVQETKRKPAIILRGRQ